MAKRPAGSYPYQNIPSKNLRDGSIHLYENFSNRRSQNWKIDYTYPYWLVVP
jgi:hypothetical protein